LGGGGGVVPVVVGVGTVVGRVVGAVVEVVVGEGEGVVPSSTLPPHAASEAVASTWARMGAMRRMPPRMHGVCPSGERERAQVRWGRGGGVCARARQGWLGVSRIWRVSGGEAL
jgi:hypothetical protein